MITTELLVSAVFAAIVIALFYALALEKSLTGLVKRIDKAKAYKEEDAKTLKELGYKSAFLSFFASFFAKGGSVIARAIVKLDHEKHKQDAELLFAEKKETRYYLPQENRTRSFEKHLGEKTPFWKIAILIVALAVLAYISSTAIRLLSSMANALVSGNEKNPVGVERDESSLLQEQEKLENEILKNPQEQSHLFV